MFNNGDIAMHNGMPVIIRHVYSDYGCLVGFIGNNDADNISFGDLQAIPQDKAEEVVLRAVQEIIRDAVSDCASSIEELNPSLNNTAYSFIADIESLFDD